MVAAGLREAAEIGQKQGNYAAAQGLLEDSLEHEQQANNPAGEATTWYRLGLLATKLGRLAEGTRLVALSALLHKACNHTDLEAVLCILAAMHAKLKNNKEQIETVFREVAEAYKADQGSTSRATMTACATGTKASERGSACTWVSIITLDSRFPASTTIPTTECSPGTAMSMTIATMQVRTPGAGPTIRAFPSETPSPPR